MINLMDSSIGETINEMDKCLDPNLWYACAGGITQIPPVNSKVIYFAQGHIEHACPKINLIRFPRISPLIPCRISSTKYLADTESDEVYAKIRLVPLGLDENGIDDDEANLVEFKKNEEKSFAKILTQSDANNGGGFSVPRYCAEMIFPRLDLKADPPVQAIVVRDVHGEEWRFRHIYRGTPRRHLLTTGWSNFVNSKKLVAGDSIVFSRADNDDLSVGIRRAKTGTESSSLGGWNARGFYGTRNKERGESVIEAAGLAASGQPFEVVYYPRAGTPEFVVRASAVRDAMKVPWCSGMRFRMAFETEDSSPVSWFTGTVSNAQVEDRVRWPNSPWRFLQVTWDEPDLLQNLKRVNPWLVEPVQSLPGIHNFPFLQQQAKRARFQIPMLSSSSSKPVSPSSPLCYFDNIPAAGGIQGARHSSQYVLPSQDFNFNHPQMGIGLGLFDYKALGYTTQLSSLEEKENAKEVEKEKEERKAPAFYLFGKAIHTEEQLSESSSSGSAVIQNNQGEALSDGNDD